MAEMDDYGKNAMATLRLPSHLCQADGLYQRFLSI